MKDKARNGELLRGPELLTIASTKGELPQGPSEPTRALNLRKVSPYRDHVSQTVALDPSLVSFYGDHLHDSEARLPIGFTKGEAQRGPLPGKKTDKTAPLCVLTYLECLNS